MNIYYDETEGKLVGNVQSKIRKWLKLGLIEQVNSWVYRVHPIAGYNSTIHTVQLEPSVEMSFNVGEVMGYHQMTDYSCSCQGFSNRGGCSHITAVQLFVKQGRDHGAH